MAYLEERGIVHRDLAARNVLGMKYYIFSCIFGHFITIFDVEFYKKWLELKLLLIYIKKFNNILQNFQYKSHT